MMGIGSNPYAVNPGAREQMFAAMQQASQQTERERSLFANTIRRLEPGLVGKTRLDYLAAERSPV
jgi:hypothetical protein